jgi:two-component system, response regulator PdtaR
VISIPSNAELPIDNPAKVLIFEDEGIVALDLQSQLTLGSFADVEVTDNGEDALHKVERCKPDVILMDIYIKGSMDGVEAASIIRSRYGLPVVFMTAHSDPEMLERARLTEPAGFLSKPLRRDTVKATIIRVLDNLPINRRSGMGCFNGNNGVNAFNQHA